MDIYFTLPLSIDRNQGLLLPWVIGCHSGTKIKCSFAGHIPSKLQQYCKVYSKSIIFNFQDDVDINSVIAEVKQSQPFVLRLSGTESCQYFILAEGEVVVDDVQDIREVYKILFGTYYVFNISYPKFLSCPLIFIQHYILNIPHKNKLPSSLPSLHASLLKLQVDV